MSLNPFRSPSRDHLPSVEEFTAECFNNDQFEQLKTSRLGMTPMTAPSPKPWNAAPSPSVHHQTPFASPIPMPRPQQGGPPFTGSNYPYGKGSIHATPQNNNRIRENSSSPLDAILMSPAVKRSHMPNQETPDFRGHHAYFPVGTASPQQQHETPRQAPNYTSSEDMMFMSPPQRSNAARVYPAHSLATPNNRPFGQSANGTTNGNGSVRGIERIDEGAQRQTANRGKPQDDEFSFVDLSFTLDDPTRDNGKGRAYVGVQPPSTSTRASTAAATSLDVNRRDEAHSNSPAPAAPQISGHDHHHHHRNKQETNYGETHAVGDTNKKMKQNGYTSEIGGVDGGGGDWGRIVSGGHGNDAAPTGERQWLKNIVDAVTANVMSELAARANANEPVGYNQNLFAGDIPTRSQKVEADVTKVNKDKSPRQDDRPNQIIDPRREEKLEKESRDPLSGDDLKLLRKALLHAKKKSGSRGDDDGERHRARRKRHSGKSSPHHTRSRSSLPRSTSSSSGSSFCGERHTRCKSCGSFTRSQSRRMRDDGSGRSHTLKTAHEGRHPLNFEPYRKPDAVFRYNNNKSKHDRQRKLERVTLQLDTRRRDFGDYDDFLGEYGGGGFAYYKPDLFDLRAAARSEAFRSAGYFAGRGTTGGLFGATASGEFALRPEHFFTPISTTSKGMSTAATPFVHRDPSGPIAPNDKLDQVYEYDKERVLDVRSESAPNAASPKPTRTTAHSDHLRASSTLSSSSPLSDLYRRHRFAFDHGPSSSPFNRIENAAVLQSLRHSTPADILYDL